MNVGTKSLLFGVHQFFWHPWTVALAWRHIYGEWPKWWEWVAIICHDLGYWGCPNMDGTEGRKHPVRGAEIARSVAQQIRSAWLWVFTDFDEFHRFIDSKKYGAAAWRLAIGHSRFYARESGVPLSPLFRADKCSILFDPKKWYLLRASASGEVTEYIRNAPAEVFCDDTVTDCPSAWYDWYRQLVRGRFYVDSI